MNPDLSDDQDGLKMDLTGLKENFCGNPDDWIYGDWCYIDHQGSLTRRECYDTTLPVDKFPEGCLSPKGKFGESYEWCITARDKNHPYGGSYRYI